MPYRNKQMLRDANGDLIPQYWDVVEQEFKPLTGQGGANDVRLTGSKVEVIRYGEGLTIPPSVTIYVPDVGLSPDVLDKRYAILIKLTGVSVPNRKIEVFLNYRRYNNGVKSGDPRYLMAVETVITATGETDTPTTFVSPLKFVPTEWFNVGIRNNAEVDITLSWYIAEV